MLRCLPFSTRHSSVRIAVSLAVRSAADADATLREWIWTPPRIRLFRDVGLCQSQYDFARTLGVAKRTVGNAERGTHPPGLALRRALDQALEHASDLQRDRFLAAITTDDQSIASLAYGTTPAVNFPVTSYADTAYLEAVHQQIW